MVLFSVFVILHGLVHLLYFAHSRKIFKLSPHMIWPDESWLLTNFINTQNIRIMVSMVCILWAIGFVIGGRCLIIQSNCDKIIIYTSILSTISYLIFWNGKIDKLADQGFIGIMINIGILLITMYII